MSVNGTTYIATKKADLRAHQFAKRYVANSMNGKKTVQELYKVKNDTSAATVASEIIRKPNVQLAVREELENIGLTNDVLDKELMWIAKQKRQLAPKLSAIVEANKLKDRYPKQAQTHQHLHIQGVDKSNIDSKLEEILAEIKELSG